MAETVLAFGCVPLVDDFPMRVALSQFCDDLSRSVGARIQPHLSSSPRALARALADGTAGVGWLSPTLFVTSRALAEANAIPIASPVREGAALFHSVLFVADSAPERDLAELAGKRVAWVAPTSAAGYVFPRLAIARRRLDPKTFFGEERFVNTHGAVAAAVLAGEVDVGATFAVFEKADPSRRIVRAGFSEVAAEHRPRVLDVAGPIAADVICVSSSVPDELRHALTGALQLLAAEPETSSRVRVLFGADGFEAFSPSSADRLRELAQVAHAAGLSAD